LNASAFVVGPPSGAGTPALIELAHALGFAKVAPFATRQSAEKQAMATPLVFFLFAAVGNLRNLKPTADGIRQSRSAALRFAPMIYFARKPDLDIIRGCIQMGFDDVIALPFGEGVNDRIMRQVGRMQVYYETASYFGPDRRDRNMSREQAVSGASGEYRRYEIVRSPEKGIDVLHDDFQVVV
jgi:hypothetical protein